MKLLYYSACFVLFLMLSASSCQNEDDAVTPQSAGNCCGTDLGIVTLGGAQVEIPNLFTPNGDGVNDIFFTSNLPSNFRLTIFSGSTKVYDVANYLRDFNGKDINGNALPDGNYRFVLERNTEKVEGNFCIIRTAGNTCLNSCRLTNMDDPVVMNSCK